MEEPRQSGRGACRPLYENSFIIFKFSYRGGGTFSPFPHLEQIIKSIIFTDALMHGSLKHCIHYEDYISRLYKEQINIYLVVALGHFMTLSLFDI